MADVKVVGLEDLGKTVEMFTQQLQRQMVRKAANAGAEVFRKEVRLRAPVRTEVGKTGFRETAKGREGRQPGYLKKHIGRTAKVVNDGDYAVSVGPTKGAFYARFNELGTRHQPAKPFMRPAFDSKSNEAERVFAETLKTEIEAGLAR